MIIENEVEGRLVAQNIAKGRANRESLYSVEISTRDIVDKAVAVPIAGGHTRKQLVLDKRCVPEAFRNVLPLVAEPNGQLAGGFIFRAAAQKAQSAGGGGPAEKCALRTFEHFNAVYIEKFHRRSA